MSTETFYACDRCGVAQRKRSNADVAGWRYIESTGPAPSQHAFFTALVNPQLVQETESDQDLNQSWHLCPDCGKQLPLFFTATATEKSSGVPSDS